MSYTFVPNNPAIPLYEANHPHFAILSVASSAAWQDISYNIWHPEQPKPFAPGWMTNDGQYLTARDAELLGAALQEYLRSPDCVAEYSSYYEREYSRLALRYKPGKNRPDRETRIEEFLLLAGRWADFLRQSGGFAIY